MSWFFIAVHLFLICQNKLVWSCDKIQYESGTWSIRSFSLESNRLLDDLPLENCVAKVREGKQESQIIIIIPRPFSEKRLLDKTMMAFSVLLLQMWFEASIPHFHEYRNYHSFWSNCVFVASNHIFRSSTEKGISVLCNRLFFEKSIQIMILYQFTTDIVQNTTFCSFGNILKWSWDSLSNTSHIHTPFFTQQCNFLPLIHRSSAVCVEDPKKTH